MKEELLEAIYGTVERLEQKVDELSASPKNTEAESTPVSVSVDTSKLEKICHNLRTTEFMVLFSAFLGFISMQNQENKVAF